MTTTLTKELRRALPREGLVVKFTPEGIYTREAGKRTWWGPTPWGKVHWSCQKVQIDQAVAEKKTRRRRTTRAKVGLR